MRGTSWGTRRRRAGLPCPRGSARSRTGLWRPPRSARPAAVWRRPRWTRARPWCPCTPCPSSPGPAASRPASRSRARGACPRPCGTRPRPGWSCSGWGRAWTLRSRPGWRLAAPSSHSSSRSLLQVKQFEALVNWWALTLNFALPFASCLVDYSQHVAVQ